VRPLAGLLADALKLTFSPIFGADGEKRKLAVGTVPPATSTVCVVVLVNSSSQSFQSGLPGLP